MGWVSYRHPHHRFSPPALCDTIYDPDAMPLPIWHEGEFHDWPEAYRRKHFATRGGCQKRAVRSVHRPALPSQSMGQAGGNGPSIVTAPSAHPTDGRECRPAARPRGAVVTGGGAERGELNVRRAMVPMLRCDAGPILFSRPLPGPHLSGGSDYGRLMALDRGRRALSLAAYRGLTDRVESGGQDAGQRVIVTRE